MKYIFSLDVGKIYLKGSAFHDFWRELFMIM